MDISYLSVSHVPSKFANSVHVMEMCQAFVKNRHRVTLYSITGHLKVPDLFAYYGIEVPFKIVQTDAKNVRFLGAFFYTFATFWKVLCRKKPDLFYARSRNTLALVSLLRTPFIFESHAPPKPGFDSLIQQWLLTRKNFRRLVVISHVLKEMYLKKFPWLAPANIVVAHDGANTEKPRSSKTVSLKGAAKLNVGYVGHLYRGRGIEIILAMAESLSDVGFHIVGGSEEDLKYWLSKTKSPNIFFYGFIPHGQIFSYYERFDVVLSPYQNTVTIAGKGDTSQWMSPLKLFEYMAAGRPIICSDIPVLREILTDGVSALLVPPSNVKAWIDALLSMKDEKLRQALVRNGQDLIKARYSWRVRAKRVLES